jgi:amino acid transporter
MISSFSSLNGIMLAAPRIFFAMADDGLLFGAMARVHPRFKTPHLAILLAAFLGMMLVFSRTFEAITNTFVLAIWPFYALSVAAIFRLRRLRPDASRPYKVPGYPIVPALFILAVVWFVLNALVNEPVPTMATFALILAGIPVYLVCFSKRT